MYGFQPKSARGKTVPQLADGGPVPFGSRGVAAVRDLIPKMQAMGFQPAPPPAAPADTSNTARLRAMIPQMEAMGYKQQPQYLADGGMVHSIKGMLGLRPKTREELLASDAKAQARNQEAAARVAERAAAQQPAPAASAPQSAITDYAGMSAMQRREKEQGLKNGGMVKPHGFKAGGLIRGPGTGTSDSIETEKRPGTFIMPADSTQAIGPEALEELGEPEEMGEEAESMEGQGEAGDDDAVPVRLSNGEFELPPEQVQALGEAVLTVLRNATHERSEEQQKAIPKAAGFAPRQFFADGGPVETDVTRVGNSYSGGNVGGSVSINGQAGAGTMSTVPAPVVPAPTTAAAPVAAAAPTATPAAPAAPAAAPAAPMGWAERNAQRSNQVTASSILDSPERRAAQAALAPAPAPAPTLATTMDVTKQKPVGVQPPALGTMQTPAGFQPRRYANGGTVQDDERARRLAQIPTGSNVPVPPPDGSNSTELSRNVNNGLNALGGMGVVASVPLRAGQAAKAVSSGAPALQAPAKVAAINGPAGSAARATDFVAGMGSNATVSPMLRIGNAPTPTLPAVNAALQEGAQANALSAAARTASGAGAAATGASNTQPADAANRPPAPSEYGRQMASVGGALADGAAWLGKTIVSAPGYGFNRPDAPATTQRTASTAGAGRGSVNPTAVVPAKVTTTAPVTAEETAQTAAAPTQAAAEPVAAPQTTNPNQVAAGFVPGGVPAAIPQVVAPTVRNSTNDWAARKALENAATAASSITANGGRFDQNGPAGSPQAAAYRAALANDQALQQAQPGMEQAAMRENGANQRATLQDAGATGRTVIQDQGATTREAGRTALAQGEQELRRTAAGFQTRAAAQQEALRNVLLDPKATPEQRKVAQRSLAALSGKTAADRMQVVNLPDTVTDQGVVAKGGQALIRTLEDGTVEQVPIGGKAELPQLDKNAQAVAIRDNKSMSREQKVEALRKLGYQG